MKKVFVVLASILFLASVASATPIYVGSMFPSGTGVSQDTWVNVQSVIENYNAIKEPDLPDLGYFNIGIEIDQLPEVIQSVADVNIDKIEYLQYSLGNIEDDISPFGAINYPVYISFKYATGFSLYFVEDDETFLFPADFGGVTTLNTCNQIEWDYALSHYKVWSPQAVPEPATMLLLGTGLLGLGTLSRKKVFKK